MTCQQNLLDSLEEEAERLIALQAPGTAVVAVAAAAFDAVLLSVGIEVGLSFDTSESLQTELARSHQEYLRTSTSTRTRTRLDCQTNSAAGGRGTRTPDDVEGIINRNIDNVVNRIRVSASTGPVQLLDAWKSALTDIHNCIEDQITGGMVERTEPGPRKWIEARVRVCDRYEGE